MPLSKDVIEARIDLRVCELRVLAAQAAVDWGLAQQERRDLLGLPRDDDPCEGLNRMLHRQEVHRWYCTASWQRRRAHQLMIEPLCRICLEAGRVTPATVADHDPPHRGDFTAFRLGPLRSLCADCLTGLRCKSHVLVAAALVHREG
jgi:hypothetical protein